MPAPPAPVQSKYPLPTIKVPPGAQSKVCKCGATIYIVEMPSGRFAPINCAVPGGRQPTADDIGIGIIHFIDCSLREYFRKHCPRTPGRRYR
jgi:hypothetical protein